jgi:hypothetical protein
LYQLSTSAGFTVLDPEGVPLALRHDTFGFGIIPRMAGTYTFVFNVASTLEIAPPVDVTVRESVRLGVSTTRLFVAGQRVLYRVTLTAPAQLDVTTVENRSSAVGVFKPNGEAVAGVLPAGAYDVLMTGTGKDRFTIKATRVRGAQPGRATNPSPTAPPAHA